MAEVVKKFDFHARPSGRQKYAWNQWMNGQIWAIKCGTKEQFAAGEVDAPVKAASFANNAASYAKRTETIKSVNLSVDGDTVYIQAILLPEVEDEEDSGE